MINYKHLQVFLEIQIFFNSKCYLESSESDCYSSDSNDLNSPTIFDNNPQMEKKRKMSEAFSVSDNFGRSEKNLERSVKYDARSKFISGTTITENLLTSQDQKNSEKTSNASTVLIYPQRSISCYRRC